MKSVLKRHQMSQLKATFINLTVKKRLINVSVLLVSLRKLCVI